MSNFTFYYFFNIYNLKLPGAMSFHLIPHLPRLVAMVAKFLREKKVRNLVYYLLAMSLLLFFVIDRHGKQHKMLKNDP